MPWDVQGRTIGQRKWLGCQYRRGNFWLRTGFEISMSWWTSNIQRRSVHGDVKRSRGCRLCSSVYTYRNARAVTHKSRRREMDGHETTNTSWKCGTRAIPRASREWDRGVGVRLAWTGILPRRLRSPCKLAWWSNVPRCLRLDVRLHSR